MPRVVCSTIKESPITEPFDILIDEKILDSFCECNSCSKAFNKVKNIIKATENLGEEDKKLQNNLDGNVNEDDEEEEKTSATGS